MFVIEVIMVSHINITMIDSSRMGKKYEKIFFQALLERFISFIYSENPNYENLPSPLEYIL